MNFKIDSVFIISLCLLIPFNSLMMSVCAADAAKQDPVDYIDPIIGTNGSKRCGRTLPGPYLPFGMVQIGPDTATNDGTTSGYNYIHKTIEGFSMNHMSGVGWGGTLGNFQVMPTTGDIKFHSGSNDFDQYQPKSKGWKSDFSHANETAKPGYYKVKLDSYDIWTELTCTQRTGMLRFTFPKSDSSTIQIDLARKIGGYSGRQRNYVVDNGTIKGMIKCWGEGTGFASGTFYYLYYYATFSKPWDSHGLWNQGADLGAVADVENDDLGFYANYSTTAGEQIVMKVGISYVSMEGAQANLEQELNHWDFDAVQAQARNTWSDEIRNAGIAIKGGTEDQKTIFYTALYHTMVYPCDFTDVDGTYWGADKKVHGNKDYTTRMGFSGWDVYKHEFPLLTIMRPDIVNDQVNTFLDICNLTGRTYPLWQMTGDYTGAGLGDPGLSVVVDAYMKGIRDYDIERAYEIAIQEATGPKSTRYLPDEMNSHGYVYSNKKMAISLTLENTYGDWCISRFAEALGKTDDAAFYRKRAGQNYQKLFDPKAGWMRQKDADGRWKTEWTDKFSRDGCKEGNTYQWTWFVPHDVQGLIDLMGISRFRSELEAFFAGAPADFSPGNPYYNHSNEPVHQVISYFNFAGQPWRTQYWTRTVLDGAYGTTYEGLAHNDDFGQLSAWYVLNAIGFNPVAPGENVWHIGSPVFDEITITLDSKYHKRTKAKTFTITAENNSPKNVYIQSAILNGKPLNRPWITHEELISGGNLKFEMGPSRSPWGSDRKNRPPSLSNGVFPPAISVK
ncbi:MAG: GH92 family glycosyl hydrolase [Planctomycetota bacterium]|jgi:predicted alpha-1,2-mannosidase